MIVTLTPNPSVDYVAELDAFEQGAVNRCRAARFYAAGKGVNVSRELSKADVANKAVCLCGTGRVADMFTGLLDVNAELIKSDNCDTRLNVKLNVAGKATEVNGGFAVHTHDLEAVERRLHELLHDGDILALCGSLPNGAPDSYYADLTRTFAAKGVKIFADTSGKAFAAMPESGAFLLKPNSRELGELFNVEINSIEKAARYAQKLAESGAGLNVAVSLAELGAVGVCGGETFVSEAAKVNAVYTVGAGDAFLAGFIAEFTKSGGDFKKSLEAAVAAGTRYVAGDAP